MQTYHIVLLAVASTSQLIYNQDANKLFVQQKKYIYFSLLLVGFIQLFKRGVEWTLSTLVHSINNSFDSRVNY